MRTPLLLVVALLLPLAALADAASLVPGPDPLAARGAASSDVARTVRTSLFVPDGQALKGEVVDGALVLAAAPLEDAQPSMNTMATSQSANCRADVPGTFWVPARSLYAVENVASEGGCTHQNHTFAIRGFYFSNTAVNGWGMADAYDHPTGSRFVVQCWNDDERWVYLNGAFTKVEGATCVVDSTGVPINEYSLWDSVVDSSVSSSSGDVWIEWHS